MRKQFVVPVLREEAAFVRLTLQFQVISSNGGCGSQCYDGIPGI